MASPPLQLERTFYDYVRVAAQRDHTPSDDVDESIEVKVDLRTAQLKESPDRWNVVADISIARREEGPVPPYVVKLRCWSVFRMMQPDLDEADALKLAAVTGGSIVYSGAREYLAMLTARGPWGAFVLPVVSFLGTELETSGPPAFGDAEMTSESEDAPPKKAATAKRRPSVARSAKKTGSSKSAGRSQKGTDD